MDTKLQNNQGLVVMVSTVYSLRLSEHLKSAESLLEAKDYVQAGEKVWGALTALVNSRFDPEAHGVDVKESRFRSLFVRYEGVEPNLRKRMKQLNFRDVGELFKSIYSLHKYFYGGTSYNATLISRNIEFFIQLITELSKQ